MQRLQKIMRQLRAPEGGCAWNRQQTLESLRPYIIEEAHELASAIESADNQAIVDELGDVLLQVIFCAQIGSEQGAFDMERICAHLADKITARHGHVFAQNRALSAQEISQQWEAQKAKAAMVSPFLASYALPISMPALMRAQKLQKRAASVGFDWEDITGVVAKLDEEIQELKQALADGHRQHSFEELGDVLFVLASLARHLNADAEQCAKAANQKFIRRFDQMQQILQQQGCDLAGADAAQFDAAWQQVKQEE